MFPFTFDPVRIDWIAHEDFDERDNNVIRYHYCDKAVDPHDAVGHGLENPD